MANDNNMLSPMWRMAAQGGVTSEDFINQKNQSNPRAFYNKMWRFHKDQDNRAEVARAAAEKKAAAEAALSGSKKFEPPPPLDTHLTREAIAKGLPVPVQDTAQASAAAVTGADPSLSLPTENPDPDDLKITDPDNFNPTRAELEMLSKAQLIEIAAAVGVANLSPAQNKTKLIDLILDKKSA